MPEPGRDAGKRVIAANLQDVREETDGVPLPAADPPEVDDPDPVGELRFERARRLDREPALADARRAGQRHEAVLVQQRRDLGELVVAADERGRRRGEVAATPAAGREGGDRRVLCEDRLLEPPELGPRLEPELVREHPPRLLEDLERIRLAPAAVERQHQLPPQPLAERVVGERRTKGRHELAMLAERERDLELLLERIDVERLEAARLRVEPRRPGQPLQRRPAPQRRCRRHGVGRGGDVAVAQRRPRLRQQLLEVDRVDARPRDRVSVGRADDRVLPQRSAEAGDVMVQRVPRSRRQLLSPNAVDEGIDRHDPSTPQGEHRQQGLALCAAHVRLPLAHEHLERAENTDLQWLLQGLPPPAASLSHLPARREGRRGSRCAAPRHSHGRARVQPSAMSTPDGIASR